MLPPTERSAGSSVAGATSMTMLMRADFAAFVAMTIMWTLPHGGLAYQAPGKYQHPLVMVTLKPGGSVAVFDGDEGVLETPPIEGEVVAVFSSHVAIALLKRDGSVQC